MRNRSRLMTVGLGISMAAAVLVVPLLACLPAIAGARNPCKEPGNLTYNCSFDDFGEAMDNGRRLVFPSGWWYFILAGTPEFRPAVDTYWGAPSLELVSDGLPFTAGIYQQVQVTPGVVYQTDAGWAAGTAPDFERKLGLDASGGTDPCAPTVLWSRSDWGMDAWPDLTVSARAVGPTMTVFVWVGHNVSHGADSIFFDAVGLWPDPNQPAATVTAVQTTPAPTATRKPAVRTAMPVLPSATATELPASPTPTQTPTAVATETATSSPTPTSTATPSPLPPTATATPTLTPTRTAVPVMPGLIAAKTGGSGPGVAQNRQQAERHKADPGVAFLYVAGGALGGALLLAGAGLSQWTIARRNKTESDRG